MNKKIILFLMVCLLEGCTHTPNSTSSNVSWQTHLQQLNVLDAWSFRGKVAVITPEDRHSLNIYWQQLGDEFHITLTTFIGGTILELNKTKQFTEIIDSKGQHYYGEDTESLIKDLSGLVIPVQALQQWIKGNPTDANYLLNNNNQVLSLSGIDYKNIPWEITYSQYMPIKNIYLPKKVNLKQQDMRLKFAISEWKIAPH